MRRFPFYNKTARTFPLTKPKEEFHKFFFDRTHSRVSTSPNSNVLSLSSRDLISHPEFGIFGYLRIKVLHFLDKMVLFLAL